MKAQNLALHPGKASTSESNSEAQVEQITRTPNVEEIRSRAYELHVGRGGNHGLDTDDWLQAERELSGRNK